MEAEILKDHVIFTKYKRVKRGSRKYDQNYLVATTALNVNFCVAEQNVPSSHEVESDSLNTRYKIIQ